jgi:hypothetical protein
MKVQIQLIPVYKGEKEGKLQTSTLLRKRRGQKETGTEKTSTFEEQQRCTD